jgi:hypothetical protein
MRWTPPGSGATTTGWRKIEDHFVAGHGASHPHIGQAERLVIAAAVESDASAFADCAVHAVSAYEIAGTQLRAVLHRRGYALVVLRQIRDRPPPKHLPAKFGEALQ